VSGDYLGPRDDYADGRLTEDDCGDDPVGLLRKWIDDATRANLTEPTACALATARPDGRPSNRIVLLRKIDEGLVFFTNYESRKGQELEANPFAAMTFFWPALQRQVRVEGTVARTSSQESDHYFASRPRQSRIAALASPQSRPVAGREELERRADELSERFPEEVPRPPHWGGYRLIPGSIEFWQGRPGRLHDRILFRKSAGRWVILRLAP
jgi:pyridoxamine 5'-phosphate oxidase